MIIIKNISGRFGNNILHYNNLVQISKLLNIDFNSFNFESFDLLNLKNNYNLNTSDFIELNSKDILNLNNDEIINRYKDKDIILNPCLGELFFKFNYNIREIFKPKSNILNKNKFNCSVNFRGLDFHSWNPLSILPTEYYINSIEYTKRDNVKYYLFADDKNLESYNETIKYLTQNNLDFEYGITTFDNSHFINDFFQLCDSDMIISSPSTFAICAGFMGKEKTVIHSEKWVKSRVEKNDLFWLGVSNGGNENYKVEKLI